MKLFLIGTARLVMVRITTTRELSNALPDRGADSARNLFKVC